MKQWDAIWFDLDDTLIDYERTFRTAIYHCFTTFFPNQAVSFLPWFRVFKAYCDRYWPDYAGGRLTRKEYRRLRFLETMRVFHIKISVKTADEFHAYFDEVVGRFAIALPGIISLLERLQSLSLPLGIITNGESAIQREKIAYAGLRRFFSDDAVVISEEVGCEKPDVAIFRCAQRRLPFGKQPVYIGDSWELDVMGALHAGWRAIYFQQQPVSAVSAPSAVICLSVEQLASILLGEPHVMEKRGRRR
ncbi:HAD family hydrolase [Saccharococcus caldoxylosilyticus]|uniref:Putative hydrolase n=1 Tax=Parageobacillus caldoxylosilyticus NBRC 107762 TaxID=1220594 RepID=A0A023DAI5_9BACL|nr:HAD-IA family hydrolase [Parageobacillus caldoxylosilyticus]OQP04241.1 haloacid dehalogenase [Geobacillus sp. 44B]MBB3851042.1 putative hydrolase of the HAD superfamily [Parageobacillus caldoxylosilyticus]QNU36441.1 HAD-IA family hydrolase [Geobacillus sp. 44B]QXJ39525.1 Pyrimidine 5'-nucleotidase YjjG [Parageobacillus caldoxylosilyticus]BDG36786.1 haloacid dehalogenase [Parageobacillus caldoxylosilyticus]